MSILKRYPCCVGFSFTIAFGICSTYRVIQLIEVGRFLCILKWSFVQGLAAQNGQMSNCWSSNNSRKIMIYSDYNHRHAFSYLDKVLTKYNAMGITKR